MGSGQQKEPQKEYTQVQFVLVSASTSFKYEETTPFRNNKTWIISIRGDPNEETDLMNRVQFTKTLVEKAFEMVDNSQHNLKVLVTPEFFFRPVGGSYSEKGVRCLLEKLQQTIEDPKFADWIFVFGTIVGHFDQNQNCIFAPILRGGRKDLQDLKFVKKETVSGIDFMYDTRNCPPLRTFCPDHRTRAVSCCPKWAANVDLIYRTEQTFAEYDLDTTTNKFVETASGSVNITSIELVKVKATLTVDEVSREHKFFKIDGVSICVEICLDHCQNVVGLKKVGFARSLMEKYNIPRTHLHIVTSSGMPNLVKTSICAAKDGLVVYNDGILLKNEIHKVTDAAVSFGADSSLKLLEDQFKSENFSHGYFPSGVVLNVSKPLDLPKLQ
jgi:hypothetical protein